jgi:hypothetical protein
MPVPCGPHDCLKIGFVRCPSQHSLSKLRVGNERGWISGPPRSFDDWNGPAANGLNSRNDLSDGVPATSAQVHTLRPIERRPYVKRLRKLATRSRSWMPTYSHATTILRGWQIVSGCVSGEIRAAGILESGLNETGEFE